MGMSIALGPSISYSSNRLKVLHVLLDPTTTVEDMLDELPHDRSVAQRCAASKRWTGIQPIPRGTYPGLSTSILRAELSLPLTHETVSLASRIRRTHARLGEVAGGGG